MIQRLIPSLLLVVSLLLASAAHAISTEARNAVLMDFQTGEILYDKNADEQIYPASMTKIMTAYLTFERIRDGRLSLNDTLRVSENAWRKGGSKMFVELGNSIRIEDLLRGVIVQSGNDASIVLAEGLAGTEEDFAREMTARAKQLGMTSTVFKNSTGWPDPDHLTTVKDLAILSHALIKNFPELYSYYSEPEFTYHGIRQANRNPLLNRNLGADGVKTGHTEEAGYCLASSARQDGRRLILVVAGLKSEKARADESEKLMRWGFREFDNFTVFKAGQPVDQAPVWMGQQVQVPLTLTEDLVLSLPRRSIGDVRLSVNYTGPLRAPLEKSQKIAELTVEVPGRRPARYDLVAGQAVEKLRGLDRMQASLGYLIWGYERADASQPGAD